MNCFEVLKILHAWIPENQCWWILEFVTQQKKEVLLITNYILTQDEEKKIHKISARLQAHEPIAYILGTIPFLNLELRVEKPILIPRPETEFFTAHCIELLKPHPVKTILDIGTGSGCVGLSLAKALPVHVTLSDISEHACTLAQKNADQNKLKNISIIQSDVFTDIPQKFDVIVSNPPYIPTEYKTKLDASVLDYEDHRALFAGVDGLEIIQKIIEHAHDHLTDTDLPFKLALEVDALHTDQVVQLCLQNTFGHAWIMHDQFDRPRFIFAK